MSPNMLVEWDSGGVEAMAADQDCRAQMAPNCFDRCPGAVWHLCSAEQQHFILVCRECESIDNCT